MRNRPLPGFCSPIKTKDPDLKLERFKVKNQQGIYPIAKINPETLSVGGGYTSKSGKFSIGGGYTKRLFGPGGGFGGGIQLKFGGK